MNKGEQQYSDGQMETNIRNHSLVETTKKQLKNRIHSKLLADKENDLPNSVSTAKSAHSSPSASYASNSHNRNHLGINSTKILRRNDVSDPEDEYEDSLVREKAKTSLLTPPLLNIFRRQTPPPSSGANKFLTEQVELDIGLIKKSSSLFENSKKDEISPPISPINTDSKSSAAKCSSSSTSLVVGESPIKLESTDEILVSTSETCRGGGRRSGVDQNVSSPTTNLSSRQKRSPFGRNDRREALLTRGKKAKTEVDVVVLDSDSDGEPTIEILKDTDAVGFKKKFEKLETEKSLRKKTTQESASESEFDAEIESGSMSEDDRDEKEVDEPIDLSIARKTSDLSSVTFSKMKINYPPGCHATINLFLAPTTEFQKKGITLTSKAHFAATREEYKDFVASSPYVNTMKAVKETPSQSSVNTVRAIEEPSSGSPVTVNVSPKKKIEPKISKPKTTRHLVKKLVAGKGSSTHAKKLASISDPVIIPKEYSKANKNDPKLDADNAAKITRIHSARNGSSSLPSPIGTRKNSLVSSSSIRDKSTDASKTENCSVSPISRSTSKLSSVSRHQPQLQVKKIPSTRPSPIYSEPCINCKRTSRAFVCNKESECDICHDKKVKRKCTYSSTAYVVNQDIIDAYDAKSSEKRRNQKREWDRKYREKKRGESLKDYSDAISGMKALKKSSQLGVQKQINKNTPLSDGKLSDSLSSGSSSSSPRLSTRSLSALSNASTTTTPPVENKAKNSKKSDSKSPRDSTTRFAKKTHTAAINEDYYKSDSEDDAEPLLKRKLPISPRSKSNSNSARGSAVVPEILSELSDSDGLLMKRGGPITKSTRISPVAAARRNPVAPVVPVKRKLDVSSSDDDEPSTSSGLSSVESYGESDVEKDSEIEKDIEASSLRKQAESTMETTMLTQRALQELDFEKRDAIIESLYTGRRKPRKAAQKLASYKEEGEDESDSDAVGYDEAAARDEMLILSDAEEERMALKGKLSADYWKQKRDADAKEREKLEAQRRRDLESSDSDSGYDDDIMVID